jgi:DNA-binding NarL/FixJ family response regulator
MSAKIKLLIVDDHPLFRRGLREIIEEQRKFQIVGEASDGRTALVLLTQLQPEIIVLDIDMPGLNGLETARLLQREKATARVVFLTMYKDEDLFNAAMDAGVKAYVLKENAGGDILSALEKVAAGEVFISPSMADVKQRRSNRVQALLLCKPQIDDLTASERRILKLIAEDRTSKEIADFLRISIKTVENHRLNICHKLNLHGSHSLLKFAFENKSYFD